MIKALMMGPVIAALIVALTFLVGTGLAYVDLRDQIVVAASPAGMND